MKKAFPLKTLALVAAVALMAASSTAEARSWSHGGGYSTGSGRTGTYSGSGSAARGLNLKAIMGPNDRHPQPQQHARRHAHRHL